MPIRNQFQDENVDVKTIVPWMEAPLEYKPNKALKKKVAAVSIQEDRYTLK